MADLSDKEAVHALEILKASNAARTLVPAGRTGELGKDVAKLAGTDNRYEHLNLSGKWRRRQISSVLVEAY